MSRKKSAYQEQLIQVLADDNISDAERDGLKRLQNQFRLTDEEVQVMVERVKADKKAAQE
jgi:uncharacterized tellurite resistance protein B-like protein